VYPNQPVDTGWASDNGLYIIIDLHAAPLAQIGGNPNTGRIAADPTTSDPDFYQTSEYRRALWFLGMCG